MAEPSWFQHADLMNILIGFLILIVGWFIRREFRNFDTKLDTACRRVDNKVEKNDFELHEHDHHIECSAADCRPKTTGVIIRERRT